MDNYEDEDYVYCENCENEILQEKAHYVGGRPYCDNCYENAEEYETISAYRDDEEEEEEGDDEDDEDDEDDYDDDYD
ncbi:MAG: hypothetical protein ACFE9Z_12355 [Promethearchaeota archaeon]